MDLRVQRLTRLWKHQIFPPFLPYPEQGYIPKTMGVTLKGPTTISGTTLLPGRYVFQLRCPGTECDHVEIFTEDRSKLVAELIAMSDN